MNQLISHPMHKPFSTYISQSSLDFCPGGEPATFWVAVQNNSSDYASFQLELEPAGVEQDDSPNWYQLVSADAYSIPPKDCIRFEIKILDLPASRQGFVGILFLQAKTYSPELEAFDTQTLKLCVTGVAPQVLFCTDNFQAAPSSEISIPLEVKNPNAHPTSMDLRLTGLPTDWLIQDRKSLLLASRATQVVTFRCQIPAATEVSPGFYPFSADILQSDTVQQSQAALLEVLQGGQIQLRCEDGDAFVEEYCHHQLPERPGLLFNRHSQQANYTVTIENQSNVVVEGELALEEKRTPSFWEIRYPRLAKLCQKFHSVEPLYTEVALPSATENIAEVGIFYRPPLLGWGRYYEFEMQDGLLHPGIEVQNQTKVFSLKVLPVIARWLQGVGLLGLLILCWWLIFKGHRATVTHAQIYSHKTALDNTLEQRENTHNAKPGIVSGAENGTLMNWPLSIQRLWNPGRNISLSNADSHRSIEVVRHWNYRDNEDVDENKTKFNQVAIGFSNGDIEIYDWNTKKIAHILSIQSSSEPTPCKEEDVISRDSTGKALAPVYTGDRVFDLVFDPTGESLYSAHGSGRVWKWPLNGKNSRPECLQGRQMNSVAAMTLVEIDAESLLAIAGQRNHLKLLALTKGPPSRDILLDNYASKPARKDNHIRTLDSIEKSSKLAIGDDSGNITLVDLAACSNGESICSPVDSWQGHDGQPIRAVSLSENGCYLATAGDDGKAKLWPVSSGGSRDRSYFSHFFSEGAVIRKSRQRRSFHPFKLRPLETVDISQQGNTLWMVSGGEDKQVRVQKRSLSRLRRQFESHRCS